MKQLKILALAGVIAATAGGGAFAQDAAIKARKALMQLYGFHLGQLSAMAKGDVDYDGERAGAIAASLMAVASVDQTAMWPPGSDSDAMPDTSRALPAIWTTFPAVLDKAAEFEEAVAALAGSAGNDLESLQAGLGAVGKTCGGCHEAFRKPNN